MAIWSTDELDAIERKFPSRELKALVAEIRRLNAIATRAGDVLNHLDNQPKRALDSVSVMTMRMIEISGRCSTNRQLERDAGADLVTSKCTDAFPVGDVP